MVSQQRLGILFKWYRVKAIVKAEIFASGSSLVNLLLPVDYYFYDYNGYSKGMINSEPLSSSCIPVYVIGARIWDSA